jgi:hypothetical protein
MRIYGVIIFLISLNSWANLLKEVKSAKSDIYRLRGEYVYPTSDDEQKINSLNAISQETMKLSKFLAQTKKHIINGKYEAAKNMLINANYTKNFTRAIQYRYLALINFIEGNYNKSLEFINKKDLQTLQAQEKICILKTLNLLIIENLQEAKYEWAKCKNLTSGKSITNHSWMSSIVAIKLNENKNAVNQPFEGLSIENEYEPFLSFFLKLSIYLNKQDEIIPRLKYLGIDAYENIKIRELIGMMYFRSGELVKAYNMLEDLNTPNANNFKGNIYLAQDKYELAYAQFKLALKNKDNSQNSLERIVPIAWILKQWKDGANYVRRLSTNKQSSFFQMALEAAFITQQKNYHYASLILEDIVKKSRNSQSVEVNQLYAFNSVMLNQTEKANMYANRACAQKDGFSCWFRNYLVIWKDISKIIKQERAIIENDEDLITELTGNFTKDPIEETEYISQKDIEELENANIDLLPELN